MREADSYCGGQAREGLMCCRVSLIVADDDGALISWEGRACT